MQSLAMISSNYFYVNFGVLKKKALNGNGKMTINYKNVHIKRLRKIDVDSFLSNKKHLLCFVCCSERQVINDGGKNIPDCSNIHFNYRYAVKFTTLDGNSN